MTPTLTPGMDPTLLDTGVPGLTVTKVEAVAYDTQLKVWFNQFPPGAVGLASHVSYPWHYNPDGTGNHPGIRLPNLTVKLDWSKPIQNQRGQAARVLTHLAERGLYVVEAVGCSDELPAFVDARGFALDDGGERTTTEPWYRNGPVVSHKQVMFGSSWSDIHPPARPAKPDEAIVQLTYTDGILTDAKVVTPNKEAHP